MGGNIVILASITSIAPLAFYGCPSLTSVSFESGSQLTTIRPYAFYNSGLSGSITLPASLTSIGGGAFYDLDSLTSVSFESDSQLTTIGDQAFYNAGLSGSMEIPAKVTSIGDSSFQSCSALQTVTFDAGCKTQINIGNDAFLNSNVTSIDLPTVAMCPDCGTNVILLNCEPNPSSPFSGGFTILVNPSTWIQIAVLIFLFAGFLGIYLMFLRKGSKAVEISAVKAGIVSSLSGGGMITTMILLDDMFHSKYGFWGIVIVLMRMLHIFIALLILITIYGPDSWQEYTNFIKLLDKKHMASNPKMYALASFFCMFGIEAFVLLPWRDSDFARQSFGIPNLSLFRIIHRTTIFTGLCTIASQIPYLMGVPPTPYTIFFYTNIAVASVQILITILAYYISTAELEESATVDVEKDGVVDAERGGEAMELSDVIPNPVQQGQEADIEARIIQQIEQKLQQKIQREMQNRIDFLEKQFQQSIQQQSDRSDDEVHVEKNKSELPSVGEGDESDAIQGIELPNTSSPESGTLNPVRTTTENPADTFKRTQIGKLKYALDTSTKEVQCSIT